MDRIEITSLPQIQFAHAYAAPSYKNRLFTSESLIEVSYIVQGKTKTRTPQGEFRSEKGDIVCLFHGQPVYIECESAHEHHTVCFSVKFERKAEGLLLPPVTKASAGTKDIEKRIDDLIRQFSLYPNRRYFLAGSVLEMLEAISECNVLKQSEYSYGNTRYVERAKQYIYANLQREIRQSEIAEHLGISPQYLCGLFKKIEGTTVIDFIHRVKLEKIRGLMTKEGMKLYEAAELLGFSDPNYVSKLYKQIFHVNILNARLPERQKP